MASRVIDYKSPRTRRQRRWGIFHTWLLPLLFLPGGAGSLHWYGDDYGAVMGTLLPLLLMRRSLPSFFARLPSGSVQYLIMTLFLLAGIGLILDLLHTPRRIYLLLPPIFVTLVLCKVCVPGNIPPLKDMSYREWDPDSLCVAWSWSVYALAACVLPPVLLVRIFERPRRLIGRRSEVV